MTPTEAVISGINRGFSMAMTPDPTRLRELAEEASSTDFTREAWESVGRSLTWAMTECPSKTHFPDSQRH